MTSPNLVTLETLFASSIRFFPRFESCGFNFRRQQRQAGFK
jgi:hypothetical protein